MRTAGTGPISWHQAFPPGDGDELKGRGVSHMSAARALQSLGRSLGARSLGRSLGGRNLGRSLGRTAVYLQSLPL